MFEIEMQRMSEDFHACWKAAAIHLSKQMDGGLHTWLRAHPYPPFLEHLSFRLGNQLFFVRVEDVDGKVIGPGNAEGHISAARRANGQACVMRMRRKLFGGPWAVETPGWGLIDAATGNPINPVACVTSEKIEMTQWEIHDMAVQIVRDYLLNEGFEIKTWQGTPEAHPSIWFVGPTKKLEWVVVRATTFPVASALRPDNWGAIAAANAKWSPTGHYASVAIVSADQPFDTMDEPPVPLWRGHAMHVRFTGLE